MAVGTAEETVVWAPIARRACGARKVEGPPEGKEGQEGQDGQDGQGGGQKGKEAKRGPQWDKGVCARGPPGGGGQGGLAGPPGDRRRP